jgi:hypothetical protein
VRLQGLGKLKKKSMTSSGIKNRDNEEQYSRRTATVLEALQQGVSLRLKKK